MREELRALREWAREYVRQSVDRLIVVANVTLSSSLGDHDATDGFPSYAGEPSYQYPVRRFQHFGFRSRPPKDVAVVRVHSSGGPANGVTVAEESANYGPANLADGETALFCSNSGTIVKLDAGGNITIVPGTGNTVSIGATGLGASDGVVHGSAVEPLTGLTYQVLGSTSAVVLAKK